MRHPRASLIASTAAALAGALLTLVVTGSPAAALSCEAHPDASPEAIAAGTEVLAGEEQSGGFWDRYDFAVIGTVTAIRTDLREGSPTYGATEIDVRVAGVLGAEEAPAVMTLRAADPGWMAGYPFELGVAYFVPVQARSTEGVVNWTGPCDPVAVLDDAELGTAALLPLADTAGLPFAVAGADGGPDGGDGGSSGGSSWFVPLTSAAAIGAAATAVVVLRRRGDGSEARGDALLAVGHADQGVEGGRGPA